MSRRSSPVSLSSAHASPPTMRAPVGSVTKRRSLAMRTPTKSSGSAVFVPAAHQCPAGQGCAGAASPGMSQTAPAGHGAGTDSPASAQRKPTGHGRQPACPARGWKLPGAHGSAAPAPAAATLPAGAGWMPAAPVHVWPAGQRARSRSQAPPCDASTACPLKLTRTRMPARERPRPAGTAQEMRSGVRKVAAEEASSRPAPPLKRQRNVETLAKCAPVSVTRCSNELLLASSARTALGRTLAPTLGGGK